MLVRVWKDDAFDTRSTRRESLLNHTWKRPERRVFIDQPPPVEVIEPRACEHLGATIEKVAQPGGDRVQIGASPAVEEVVLEVVDRLFLKRTPQFIIHHSLIRSDRTPQRLRKHHSERPCLNHGEQRCVTQKERSKVIGPRHRRDVQQHDLPVWIDPDREGSRKPVREVWALMIRDVDAMLGRRSRHARLKVGDLLGPGREPVEIGSYESGVEAHETLRRRPCGDRPTIAAVSLADGVVQRFVVHVIEAPTVVDAVNGDGESAADEFVEKRVALLAAVGNAGEGGILPLDA